MEGNGSDRSIKPASSYLWSDFIFQGPAQVRPAKPLYLLGVLEGEGIGPEVIPAALRVLSALVSVSCCRFDVRFGGAVGLAAEAECGQSLSPEVSGFCEEIFSQGGAILAGPGGGRFVYDLRTQFDLFCKLVPLKVPDELIQAGRLKREHLRGVDLLLVRENSSGIYQGCWQESDTIADGRRVEHRFQYTEREARRVLEIGARIAACRRGAMSVVIKEGGIPGMSRLWRECAEEAAAAAGIECSFANVDYAAYRLIQDAQAHDVIVAPNLFGDVLADLGGVLLGSRGLTYSGNFSAGGAAVYQTNHGAAYDLAGTNRANPVGQILSLTMLLRESFGLIAEAQRVEAAIAEVWRRGWRTEDLQEPGCRVAGTDEMGERIADAVVALAQG